MLEEQTTHISDARQDEEQQQRWTSGKNSQVVTKSLSKWLNIISSPGTKKTMKNTGNGVPASPTGWDTLKGVEWVHGLFLFPLVLGKM